MKTAATADIEAASHTKTLSIGRMLAFASADFFGGGAFNIVNFLYPVFLVMAVGLPPALAGVVMLVARIVDGVIDPPIGLLSDKMRARFGSRRKTLLVSAPLILLALFFMFYPYNDPNITIRFLLALFSYVFFVIAQSSVMIPYYSLGSEITDDYTQRSRLMTLRLAFSITASIVCVALPGLIVDSFDGNMGYIVMSLSFGTVFMVLIAITAIFSREGIPVPVEKPDSFKFKDFLLPLKLKIFRQYLYTFLCCQITMAVMSTLFFFYVDFYYCRDMTALGETNSVGLIGAALMFSMQIVALPIYLAISKRIGKMSVYIIGSVIWVVGALALFILPANSPAVILYLLAAVLGFGISGPGLIPHAIQGDVIDVGNLKFGIRAAGSFSGISNMVIQIGQAAGVSLVMIIIGAAGFVEQEIGPDALPVLEQAQSAQFAIMASMALAPLILMSFGIFVCTRYRLTKDKHAEVIAAIESGDERARAAALSGL